MFDCFDNSKAIACFSSTLFVRLSITCTYTYVYVVSWFNKARIQELDKGYKLLFPFWSERIVVSKLLPGVALIWQSHCLYSDLKPGNKSTLRVMKSFFELIIAYYDRYELFTGPVFSFFISSIRNNYFLDQIKKCTTRMKIHTWHGSCI